MDLSKYLQFLETSMGKTLFPDLHKEIANRIFFDLEEWKARSDQQDLVLKFAHEITQVSENLSGGANISSQEYMEAINKMNVNEFSVFFASIHQATKNAFEYGGDIEHLYREIIPIMAVAYERGLKDDVVNFLSMFDGVPPLGILEVAYENNMYIYEPEEQINIQIMLKDLLPSR